MAASKKFSNKHTWKKGRPKTGGRVKGIENKVTRDIRECLRMVAEKQVDKLESWFNRVGKRNPAKALELFLRTVEYHIPKLNRTEHTGLGGDPLTIAQTITHQIEQTTDPAQASALYLQLVKDTSETVVVSDPGHA